MNNIKKQDKAQQVNPRHKYCISCKRHREIVRNFYISSNSFDSDGRVNVCKDCLKKRLDYEKLQTVKDALLQINKPFLYGYWTSAVDEARLRNQNNPDVLGVYLKILQLNNITRDLTWKDSDEKDDDKNSLDIEIGKTSSSNSIKPPLSSPNDERNKTDVITMVGYDPFEYEVEADKRHLYNKLVDFLDESTLEDSFKLPAVIEIVKAFNQIDKINSALSLVAADTSAVTKNVGGIKSLIDAKEKMLKSVLALAKDNGISVNHNNNKSKGGNTLNGIVKKLSEIGLDSAEVNLFDLETSDAMKQIADLSNRSILDQLMLDENDYSDMIAEQNQMIRKLDATVINLEEENRLLKIRIKQLESSISG